MSQERDGTVPPADDTKVLQCFERVAQCTCWKSLWPKENVSKDVLTTCLANDMTLKTGAKSKKRCFS